MTHWRKGWFWLVMGMVLVVTWLAMEFAKWVSLW
jgi:hypothetical protein